MMAISRRSLLCAAAAAVTARRGEAQRDLPPRSAPELPPDFVCPMDPEVHSTLPGKCPRCGMPLEARIMEPRAYGLSLTARPESVPAKLPVYLAFAITDPVSRHSVQTFELVHEKLFHLFVVSQDLEWFLHDHPALGADGIFRLPVTFPAIGMYEIFADFYPAGGSPQWISRFMYTRNAKPGLAPHSGDLKYANPQRDRDVTVNFQLDPPQPFAGRATTLLFDVNPGDGLELWLGTYAHALWVSHDLLDAEHTHPEFFGNLQFEVYFPRPGTYRFWLQFKRKGALHTVKFDVPVIG